MSSALLSSRPIARAGLCCLHAPVLDFLVPCTASAASRQRLRFHTSRPRRSTPPPETPTVRLCHHKLASLNALSSLDQNSNLANHPHFTIATATLAPLLKWPQQARPPPHPSAKRLPLLRPSRKPNRRTRRHSHLRRTVPAHHTGASPPAPADATHVRPRSRPLHLLQQHHGQAPHPAHRHDASLDCRRLVSRVVDCVSGPRGRHGVHRGRRDGDRHAL